MRLCAIRVKNLVPTSLFSVTRKIFTSLEGVVLGGGDFNLILPRHLGFTEIL